MEPPVPPCLTRKDAQVRRWQIKSKFELRIFLRFPVRHTSTGQDLLQPGPRLGHGLRQRLRQALLQVKKELIA